MSGSNSRLELCGGSTGVVIDARWQCFNPVATYVDRRDGAFWLDETTFVSPGSRGVDVGENRDRQRLWAMGDQLFAILEAKTADDFAEWLSQYDALVDSLEALVIRGLKARAAVDGVDYQPSFEIQKDHTGLLVLSRQGNLRKCVDGVDRIPRTDLDLILKR